MKRIDITQRALLFDGYRSGTAPQREFHRSVIKNGKKFVAHLAPDQIRFIPGHYAAAPLSQLRSLLQRQTVTSYDSELNRLLGSPLKPDEPLYAEIDRAYENYCALSLDSPSKHWQPRTYWLCQPD